MAAGLTDVMIAFEGSEAFREVFWMLLAPDEWSPVRAGADRARRETAAAIPVCMTCLARTQCLGFSQQHWDIGRNGVWGCVVIAERAALRRGVKA